MLDSLPFLQAGGFWAFLERAWIPITIIILVIGSVADQVIWFVKARPFKAWGRGYRKFILWLDRRGIHLPQALRPKDQIIPAGSTLRMPTQREALRPVTKEHKADIHTPPVQGAPSQPHTIYDVPLERRRREAPVDEKDEITQRKATPMFMGKIKKRRKTLPRGAQSRAERYTQRRQPLDDEETTQRPN